MNRQPLEQKIATSLILIRQHTLCSSFPKAHVLAFQLS